MYAHTRLRNVVAVHMKSLSQADHAAEQRCKPRVTPRPAVCRCRQHDGSAHDPPGAQEAPSDSTLEPSWIGLIGANLICLRLSGRAWRTRSLQQRVASRASNIQILDGSGGALGGKEINEQHPRTSPSWI